MPGRKNWDPVNMKAAVEAVKNKEMGSFKASRVFSVPQTTLERYVKLASNTVVDEIKTQLGRKPVLPVHLEEDLVNHCLLMEQCFFGMTMSDVRRLAYQLAKRNGIKNSFSMDNEKAGKKWLKGFLRRHPQLSVRSPQGLSHARATCFTPEAVNRFFNLYEPMLEKINYSPSRIYNCDETGITVVQIKHSKVLGLKGIRQISTLQSAERGALITVVTSMSASGNYVPPLLIFTRKNMKLELMNGTPPGSIFACHPSGWIQSEIFTDWFRHFINCVKPNSEDPVVLVLDGHFSHVRNLDVINLGRENHVHIVSLPPHSTHKMQPLDLAFMGPLKTYYCQEIEQWLRGNPGRVVTVYQIGELFGRAYMKAATIENAVGGFLQSGLYPSNRNIFRDHDFLNLSVEAQDRDLNQCSPSSTVNKIGDIPYEDSIATGVSSSLIRSADISPVPKIVKKGSGSRTGAAQLITSSPYKKSLENTIVTRKEKEPVTKTVHNAKSQLNMKVKNPPPTRPKRQRRKTSSSNFEKEINSVSDSDDNEEAECLYCGGCFGDDYEGEEWIRCSKCCKWAHTLCADAEHCRFVCDFCKD